MNIQDLVDTTKRWEESVKNRNKEYEESLDLETDDFKSKLKTYLGSDKDNKTEIKEPIKDNLKDYKHENILLERLYKLPNNKFNKVIDLINELSEPQWDVRISRTVDGNIYNSDYKMSMDDIIKTINGKKQIFNDDMEAYIADYITLTVLLKSRSGDFK